MARKKSQKKSRKNGKSQAAATVETTLPRNIVPFGEHVEEDKNIYIHQSVYKEIHKFTRDKTENESGGVLVGGVIDELGKTNIIIKGFVEAKYSEGTPTTLTFTHESWEYIHKRIADKFPGCAIVGWIHTHPNFGIFLSEYDKFIQENFFKGENQVAYVVDPIQKIEGFYFWINGKIERCKGFYVYDRTGTRITVSDWASEEEAPSAPSVSPALGIAAAVLAVLTVALGILCFNLSGRVSRLETRLQNNETLIEITNRNMDYLRQQLTLLTDAADGETQEGENANE